MTCPHHQTPCVECDGNAPGYVVPTALKSASYSGKKRNQRVFTPHLLVDRILKVWPYVALDPCPATLEDGTLDLEAPIIKATVCAAVGVDGLAIPWVDGTFINSPWDPLKPWLEKAVRHTHLEMMQLVPVRPHRYGGVWVQAAASASLVAWLKPVKFHGEKNQCPLPCALFYWGKRTEEFVQAFGDVSHTVRRF